MIGTAGSRQVLTDVGNKGKRKMEFPCYLQSIDKSLKQVE